MQPTGRSVPSSARVLMADGDQRNEGLCGRGLDGLQLICKSLGGRQRGPLICEPTKVSQMRFTWGVLVALSIGCGSRPSAGILAELRAQQSVCLALDWGLEPRLTWQGQLAPDTLLLLPGDGQSKWPGPSDASGPIDFAPRSSRQDASWWRWSISGDTLSIVAFTPTMDDLIITVQAQLRLAEWQVAGLGTEEGRLEVAVCKLKSPSRSAA